MNLTPEQEKQCRNEFEAWSKSFVIQPDLDGFYGRLNDVWQYYDNDVEYAYRGFQAAWRPRLTVDHVDKILDMVDHNVIGPKRIDLAQAIHQAMGGEE